MTNDYVRLQNSGAKSVVNRDRKDQSVSMNKKFIGRLDDPIIRNSVSELTATINKQLASKNSHHTLRYPHLQDSAQSLSRYTENSIAMQSSPTSPHVGLNSQHCWPSAPHGAMAASVNTNVCYTPVQSRQIPIIIRGFIPNMVELPGQCTDTIVLEYLSNEGNPQTIAKGKETNLTNQSRNHLCNKVALYNRTCLCFNADEAETMFMRESYVLPDQSHSSHGDMNVNRKGKNNSESMAMSATTSSAPCAQEEGTVARKQSDKEVSSQPTSHNNHNYPTNSEPNRLVSISHEATRPHNRDRTDYYLANHPQTSNNASQENPKQDYNLEMEDCGRQRGNHTNCETNVPDRHTDRCNCQSKGLPCQQNCNGPPDGHLPHLDPGPCRQQTSHYYQCVQNRDAWSKRPTQGDILEWHDSGGKPEAVEYLNYSDIVHSEQLSSNNIDPILCSVDKYPSTDHGNGNADTNDKVKEININLSQSSDELSKLLDTIIVLSSTDSKTNTSGSDKCKALLHDSFVISDTSNSNNTAHNHNHGKCDSDIMSESTVMSLTKTVNHLSNLLSRVEQWVMTSGKSSQDRDGAVGLDIVNSDLLNPDNINVVRTNQTDDVHTVNNTWHTSTNQTQTTTNKQEIFTAQNEETRQMSLHSCKSQSQQPPHSSMEEESQVKPSQSLLDDKITQVEKIIPKPIGRAELPPLLRSDTTAATQLEEISQATELSLPANINPTVPDTDAVTPSPSLSQMVSTAPDGTQDITTDGEGDPKDDLSILLDDVPDGSVIVRPPEPADKVKSRWCVGWATRYKDPSHIDTDFWFKHYTVINGKPYSVSTNAVSVDDHVSNLNQLDTNHLLLQESEDGDFDKVLLEEAPSAGQPPAGTSPPGLQRQSTLKSGSKDPDTGDDTAQPKTEVKPVAIPKSKSKRYPPVVEVNPRTSLEEQVPAQSSSSNSSVSEPTPPTHAEFTYPANDVVELSSQECRIGRKPPGHVYSCSVCRKVYFSSRGLKEHMMTAHGITGNCISFAIDKVIGDVGHADLMNDLYAEHNHLISLECYEGDHLINGEHTDLNVSIQKLIFHDHQCMIHVISVVSSHVKATMSLDTSKPLDDKTKQSIDKWLKKRGKLDSPSSATSPRSRAQKRKAANPKGDNAGSSKDLKGVSAKSKRQKAKETVPRSNQVRGGEVLPSNIVSNHILSQVTPGRKTGKQDGSDGNDAPPPSLPDTPLPNRPTAEEVMSTPGSVSTASGWEGRSEFGTPSVSSGSSGIVEDFDGTCECHPVFCLCYPFPPTDGRDPSFCDFPCPGQCTMYRLFPELFNPYLYNHEHCIYDEEPCKDGARKHPDSHSVSDGSRSNKHDSIYSSLIQSECSLNSKSHSSNTKVMPHHDLPSHHSSFTAVSSPWSASSKRSMSDRRSEQAGSDESIDANATVKKIKTENDPENVPGIVPTDIDQGTLTAIPTVSIPTSTVGGRPMQSTSVDDLRQLLQKALEDKARLTRGRSSRYYDYSSNLNNNLTSDLTQAESANDMMHYEVQAAKDAVTDNDEELYALQQQLNQAEYDADRFQIELAARTQVNTECREQIEILQKKSKSYKVQMLRSKEAERQVREALQISESKLAEAESRLRWLETQREHNPTLGKHLNPTLPHDRSVNNNLTSEQEIARFNRLNAKYKDTRERATVKIKMIVAEKADIANKLTAANKLVAEYKAQVEKAAIINESISDASSRLAILNRVHTRNIKKLEAWAANLQSRIDCPHGTKCQSSPCNYKASSHSGKLSQLDVKYILDRLKSVQCRHFLNGECNRGDSCPWGHFLTHLDIKKRKGSKKGSGKDSTDTKAKSSKNKVTKSTGKYPVNENRHYKDNDISLVNKFALLSINDNTVNQRHDDNSSAESDLTHPTKWESHDRMKRHNQPIHQIQTKGFTERLDICVTNDNTSKKYLSYADVVTGKASSTPGNSKAKTSSRDAKKSKAIPKVSHQPPELESTDSEAISKILKKESKEKAKSKPKKEVKPASESEESESDEGSGQDSGDESIAQEPEVNMPEEPPLAPPELEEPDFSNKGKGPGRGKGKSSRKTQPPPAPTPSQSQPQPTSSRQAERDELADLRAKLKDQDPLKVLENAKLLCSEMSKATSSSQASQESKDASQGKTQGKPKNHHQKNVEDFNRAPPGSQHPAYILSQSFGELMDVDMSDEEEVDEQL